MFYRKETQNCFLYILLDNLSLELCNCSHQIGESFRKIYPILFQFEINFRYNYDMTIDCFLTKKDERSQLINN